MQHVRFTCGLSRPWQGARWGVAVGAIGFFLLYEVRAPLAPSAFAPSAFALGRTADPSSSPALGAVSYTHLTLPTTPYV